MADDQDLNEEYILELLKKDAKKVSASYARSGTYDVLPKRPTSTAPKPNTRFLRNIIRNTDNHNAALKLKELGDAGKRLRAMAREREQHLEDDPDYRSRDRRHESDRENIRKRKRESRRRENSTTSQEYHHLQSRDRSLSPGRDSRRSHRHRRRRESRTRSPEPRSHRRHISRDGESDVSDSGHARAREIGSGRRSEKLGRDGDYHKDNDGYDRAKRHRHSKRTERGSEDTRSSRHDRSRSREIRRSRSPSLDRHERRKRSTRRDRRLSRSPEDSETNEEYRTKSRRHRSRRTEEKHDSEQATSPASSVRLKDSAAATSSLAKLHTEDDDDPLLSFLGPEPPPKNLPPQVRGRGTTSFTSGIDQRFSSTYDPAMDVVPDLNTAEDEDWDLALEALRDRQKFRQAGADRLLAAGFTKEEVERMERGGERSEHDVRWTKKGEAREWDRGKQVDENGYVSVDGDKFGRLT